MDKLIFSQVGVYRLYQLASQVRRVTGIRYKLADNSGVLELLRYCAASPHGEIQRCYGAFKSELNEAQTEKLAALGICELQCQDDRQATMSEARFRIISA